MIELPDMTLDEACAFLRELSAFDPASQTWEFGLAYAAGPCWFLNLVIAEEFRHCYEDYPEGGFSVELPAPDVFWLGAAYKEIMDAVEESQRLAAGNKALKENCDETVGADA